MNSIHVITKNKSTTLRLSEKTKKMLETLARGKETHEEIILRLIKLANNMSSDSGTKIIDQGNIIGTKYETAHRTFKIEIDGKKYSVVCKYNDLSLIALLRNNQLKNYMRYNEHIDWQLNLEIVNVNIGKGWLKPTNNDNEDSRLLYLICVKQVLEETFDIDLYQITNKEDYINIDKWSDAYNKYNLSQDSLRSDITEIIR
jgi:hypothetical protein